MGEEHREEGHRHRQQGDRQQSGPAAFVGEQPDIRGDESVGAGAERRRRRSGEVGHHPRRLVGADHPGEEPQVSQDPQARELHSAVPLRVRRAPREERPLDRLREEGFSDPSDG